MGRIGDSQLLVSPTVRDEVYFFASAWRRTSGPSWSVRAVSTNIEESALGWWSFSQRHRHSISEMVLAVNINSTRLKITVGRHQSEKLVPFCELLNKRKTHSAHSFCANITLNSFVWTHFISFRLIAENLLILRWPTNVKCKEEEKKSHSLNSRPSNCRHKHIHCSSSTPSTCRPPRISLCRSHVRFTENTDVCCIGNKAPAKHARFYMRVFNFVFFLLFRSFVFHQTIYEAMNHIPFNRIPFMQRRVCHT